MPQDFSFDIVSKVDLQEVDNAVNQAKKELLTRYDFKGSKSDIVFDRGESTLKLAADNKLQMEALLSILKQRMGKRNISLKSVKFEDAEEGLGGNVKQVGKLQLGIPSETAKEIAKHIRQSGLKVQAQIMDDQVRVTSRSKDDLQEIMAKVRSAEWEVPLQFTNFK